jgi:hypothetical protein
VADRLLEDGPAEYWSDDKPPTLGQLRALAAAACTALGLPAPKTRLAATEALVRLRLAEDEPQATRKAA